MLLATGAGFWVVLVLVLVLLVGVSVGYYSRSGSEISEHPRHRDDEPAGTSGPSRLSASEDETEGSFDTHGTK